MSHCQSGALPAAPRARHFEPRHPLHARLRQVTTSPGVYLMRNKDGTVVYVGKAKNLRRRLSDYFARPVEDPKTRLMVSEVFEFDVVRTGSERSALLLEERLIMDFLPHYNIALRTGRRRYWLCVEHSAGSPRIVAVGSKPPLGTDCRGPYPSLAVCQWLSVFLRRLYGLRGCSAENPGEQEFLHCAEHKLNGCSSPCVGRVSPEEYRSRAAAAWAWLEQPAWKLAGLLRAHMKNLAKSRQFERAAACRDVAAALSSPSTSSPSRLPSVDSNLANEQILSLQGELRLEYPTRMMEAFDISHSGGRWNVASMVSFLNGIPLRRSYRHYRIPVEGANDAECMRQAVLRHYMKHPLPDLVVVDGGLPQLAAAQSALESIGKDGTPVVALAKSNETIFRSDGTSLQLPRSSPALHLIQRIRDEAHRFANSYTRRQTSKSMSESRLRSAAGLDAKTSRRLLRKFGSVYSVALAPAEELSLVGKMSRSKAEGVKRALSKP